MCQVSSTQKTMPSAASSPDWSEQMPPSFHQQNSKEPGEAIESSGATQVWLLDPKELQRGEFWMLNTGEFPSAGGGSSSLASVLETGYIPAKYYLSRKACDGILNRARKRGKQLPPMLEEALIQQSVPSLVKIQDKTLEN
jgi:hypothetical protein